MKDDNNIIVSIVNNLSQDGLQDLSLYPSRVAEASPNEKEKAIQDRLNKKQEQSSSCQTSK